MPKKQGPIIDRTDEPIANRHLGTGAVLRVSNYRWPGTFRFDAEQTLVTVQRQPVLGLALDFLGGDFSSLETLAARTSA